jgi:hypothetical protein
MNGNQPRGEIHPGPARIQNPLDALDALSGAPE